MAWILTCKRCKFGEKICYNSGDIEFFLGDYFFLARPVYWNVWPHITATETRKHQFYADTKSLWKRLDKLRTQKAKFATKKQTMLSKSTTTRSAVLRNAVKNVWNVRASYQRTANVDRNNNWNAFTKNIYSITLRQQTRSKYKSTTIHLLLQWHSRIIWKNTNRACPVKQTPPTLPRVDVNYVTATTAASFSKQTALSLAVRTF